MLSLQPSFLTLPAIHNTIEECKKSKKKSFYSRSSLTGLCRKQVMARKSHQCLIKHARSLQGDANKMDEQKKITFLFTRMFARLPDLSFLFFLLSAVPQPIARTFVMFGLSKETVICSMTENVRSWEGQTKAASARNGGGSRKKFPRCQSLFSLVPIWGRKWRLMVRDCCFPRGFFTTTVVIVGSTGSHSLNVR